MKDTWIKVGFIANTHGVRGELKVQSLSDVPDRLLELQEAYVGEEKQKVRLQDAKPHKGMTLLKFSGFDDINRVLQWKGDYLYVKEEDAQALPENSWYHFQLIGLTAIDRDTGAAIGTVTDVLETYANDVLQIRREDGTELLIPFVEAFVGDVDLGNQTVAVQVMEELA